jgi:putative ABC transport system permease protein
MLRDVKLAIRMLRKQPGFSVIAALTLALGIGATAAVFSLIQGVLLTPPPYEKPDQLMMIPTKRVDGEKMESPAAGPRNSGWTGLKKPRPSRMSLGMTGHSIS